MTAPYNAWRDTLTAADLARARQLPNLRPLVPVFEALHDFDVPFLFGLPGSELPRPRLALRARWIVLLADDRNLSRGPAAFHADSLRWFAEASTHMAVLTRHRERDYALFAAAASAGGRVLVASTSPRFCADWGIRLETLAPDTPLLGFSS